MAVKRGKSQARRNSGTSNGLPGWAWLIIGIVITLAVVLAAPRFLRSEGQDGFFRPRANPDAQPVAVDGEEASGVAADSTSEESASGSPQAISEEERQFDFYTLLPGKEVALSDDELEQARAEERRVEEQRTQQPPLADDKNNAAVVDTTRPIEPSATASIASVRNEAHYLLQAGSFSASGDAEALKARIALLGLGARVESADIGGKTVYRVRMGPYGTASELAEAKGKLGQGGLPALAIRAK